MNKKLMTAIAASVITMVGTSTAVADFNWGFAPYVGLDAQWRNMAFKKDFGRNVAPENYPQGNVYLGAKFCDWIGVELGYESTTAKDRRAVVLGSDIVFGLPAEVGGNLSLPDVFDTRVRIYGPHINLVGFWPISEDYCLQLFGSVGVAALKLKIISDQPIALGQPKAIFASDHREFGKRKLIPRATVGIQHMLNHCFGVRASIGWENTSRFKDVKTTIIGLKAKLQDSVNVGFGIFYNF